VSEQVKPGHTESGNSHNESEMITPGHTESENSHTESHRVFFRKLTPLNAPIITFNNAAIAVCDYQKHLGLVLDKKLAFHHQLNEKFLKAHKGIGLMNRLREISTKGLAFKNL